MTRSHCRTCLAAALAALCLLPALPATEGRTLAVITPDGYLPGVPVLVRVEVREADGSIARDPWDATADLTSDSAALSPDAVRLWNGRGSVLVTIAPTTPGDPVTILAAAEGLAGQKALASLAAAPVADVSGALPAGVTEWSGVVHVTGTVTVPSGATLRLLEGTLVLIDGASTKEIQPGECKSVSETPTKCGTDIVVRGAIECLGTEDRPVTITAQDPLKAWGEIRHESAAPSVYRWTAVTRGGNSPVGGHTNTGPELRLNSSKVDFEDSSLTDTAGKTMIADGSDLTFRRCLLARSIMGPEVGGTAVIVEDSHIVEMYGRGTVDDDDGIYLHDQKAGQEIAIRRTVIASGDDDGIDTLGSTVTVEDCIIRDWHQPNEDSKGISVFSGEVDVLRTVLVNNKVGISAKGQSTGATVRIDRTTVVGVNLPIPGGTQKQVGIQAFNKFGVPDLKILYFVTNSIVEAPDAVYTDYPPADMKITWSDLSETWAGDGNITSDPLFADAAAGDYHLSPASPCIDAGDPAAAPDADGSRADQGALPTTRAIVPKTFERGAANGESGVDLGDAIAILVHLFEGGSIACREAADANDDGAVDVTDVLAVLEFLFAGGAPLPPPTGACGPDPTPDALGCDAPVCP